MRDLVRRLDNIDRRVREVSRSHHGGAKGTLEERVATAEAAIAKLLDLEEEDATEIERVDAAEQIDAENIEQHTNQLTAHGESIGKHKKQLDTVDAREKADKTELDGKLKTASEQQQKDKTAVDKALKVLDDREAKNHTAQQQTLDKHTTQIDALEKRKPDTSAVEKKLQALDDREKKNNTAVAQSVSDLDKREAKNHTAQNTQLTQQKQTTDALDAREKKNNTTLAKTVTDLDKREAADKTELSGKITALDKRLAGLEKATPPALKTGTYSPYLWATGAGRQVELGKQGARTEGQYMTIDDWVWIQLKFVWSSKNDGWDGGWGDIMSSLPAHIDAAPNSILSAGLLVPNGWFWFPGYAEVSGGAIWPKFPTYPVRIVGSGDVPVDTTMRPYKISGNERCTPGSGSPFIVNGYPEGGWLTISGGFKAAKVTKAAEPPGPTPPEKIPQGADTEPYEPEKAQPPETDFIN